MNNYKLIDCTDILYYDMVNHVINEIINCKSEYIGFIENGTQVHTSLLNDLVIDGSPDFIELATYDTLTDSITKGSTAINKDRYELLFPKPDSPTDPTTKPYVPKLVLYKTITLQNTVNRFSHIRYPMLSYGINFFIQILFHYLNNKLVGLACNTDTYATIKESEPISWVRKKTAYTYYARILRNLGITSKQYTYFSIWSKMDTRR